MACLRWDLLKFAKWIIYVKYIPQVPIKLQIFSLMILFRLDLVSTENL